MTTRKDLNSHLDRGIKGQQRKEIALIQSKRTKDPYIDTTEILRPEKRLEPRECHEVVSGPAFPGLLSKFLNDRKKEAAHVRRSLRKKKKVKENQQINDSNYDADNILPECISHNTPIGRDQKAAPPITENTSDNDQKSM